MPEPAPGSPVPPDDAPPAAAAGDVRETHAAAPPRRHGLESAEVARLRRLLLGPDRDAALERALRGGGELDPDAVAALLPDAVRARTAQDDDLGRALAPSIEAGLKTSVERNPQPIVDAIFPVIGPAIRRAIQAALAQSMQSINQSVNYGLSLRGLAWRVEAWRSGVSFGEVVLRHTLAYRVEEVLLVHRETGLLLKHVVAPDVPGAGEDADVVSAMLTAVQQFVGDSFEIGEGDALETIEVGDLHVWIEPGPRAVVAAVIRGHPPEAYHTVLSNAVETIHARLGEALSTFTGDTDAFDAAGEILEDCLDRQSREQARSGPSPKLVVLALLAVGLLGWWGWRTWQARAAERGVVRALAATPGVEVLATERHDGRLRIVAARDPLAPPPPLPDGWAEHAELRTVTAYADGPDFLARRARAMLGVPDSVALRADSAGVLIVTPPDAGAPWLAAAQDRLRFVPGATSLVTERPTADVEGAARAVGALVLTFGDGLGAAEVERARRAVAALDAAASTADRDYTLTIVGHTDDTGTDEQNARVGRRRAEAVRDALGDAAGRLRVEIETRGARDRLGDGVSLPSRRVTFRARPGALS